MEIIVFKERENMQEKIIFSGKTVEELLNFLKINPETVIVVRNNEVLTEEENLENKDHLDLLSVISGG